MTNTARGTRGDTPGLEKLVSEAAKAVGRELEERAAPRGGRNVRALLAGLAMIGLVIVLVSRRDALRAPAPDPRLAAVGKAVALIDARNRVFAAWDSTGRLPESLRKVGPPQPMIAFSVTDSSFRFAFTRIDGDSVRVEYTRNNRHGTFSR